MAGAVAITDDESLAAALDRVAAGNGRPSKFTLDTAAQFIDRLINGESITRIAKDSAMPSVATLYYWRLRHPSFQKAWDHARKLQGETAAALLHDSCMELLTNGANMTSVETKAHGVAHRGLQFLAERQAPDIYQETKRVQVSHTHNVADRLARARVIDAEIIEPEGEGEGG